MARTRAHPPRRLTTARGESEITEARRPASPTPSPQKRLSPGVCLRQSGLLGRRTPDHNPPPEEGLMLTRGHYGPCLDVVGFGCPRWFAGLSTPPIHPSPPGVASGGYGRPGCRGSPPPATGNNQEQHSRAIGRQLDPGPPGPWRILDEGQLLHHLRPSPPGPRAAGSSGTGASTRNNQNTGI